ncbi:MAG: hypothetical protein KGJ13_04345 [Patescibacteria group bacterium]|nr:hypothetical protein [Patescibacteria group bacterium]
MNPTIHVRRQRPDVLGTYNYQSLATFYNSKPMQAPKKNEAFHANLALAKEERPIPAVGGVIHDKKQYKKDKETIRKGIAGFIETGTALARVRDTRSFEIDGYGTFDEFCLKEYDITRQYGNRLIAASELVRALPEYISETIVSENQAQALAKAEPEEREEIVSEVAAEAKESGKKVTAKAIEKKIEEKKKKAEPEAAEFRELIKDAVGNEVPEYLYAEWKRGAELEKLLTKPLRDVKKMMSAGIDNDKAFVHLDQAHLVQMQNMIHALEIGPHVVHVSCEGKGCKDCRKRGYLTEQVFKRLPKEVKEKYGSK